MIWHKNDLVHIKNCMTEYKHLDLMQCGLLQILLTPGMHDHTFDKIIHMRTNHAQILSAYLLHQMLFNKKLEGSTN